MFVVAISLCLKNNANGTWSEVHCSNQIKSKLENWDQNKRDVWIGKCKGEKHKI